MSCSIEVCLGRSDSSGVDRGWTGAERLLIGAALKMPLFSRRLVAAGEVYDTVLAAHNTARSTNQGARRRLEVCAPPALREFRELGLPRRAWDASDRAGDPEDFLLRRPNGANERFG